MNGFETILPFLKPIEHLILDDSISEIMVNGADRVFIERAGFLEQVPGISSGRAIAHGRGQKYRAASWRRHLRSETHSRLAAARWKPRCRRDPAVQSWRRHAHHPQVQRPPLRDGRPDSRRHSRPVPCEPPRRLRSRTEKHPHQRRNRDRKNDAPSNSRKIHSAGRAHSAHRRHGRDSTARSRTSFDSKRAANRTAFPAVAIRDLLKASLRHRPDRIILGEIRGGEAFDLLQLLNTGHSGTLSTIHANSAKQGLARFTSCVLQSGIELPYRAIKTNIADSLNVVVQVERRPGRTVYLGSPRNQRLRPGRGPVRLRRGLPGQAGHRHEQRRSFTPKSLTAPEYVLALFEPGDNAAILVRNRRPARRFSESRRPKQSQVLSFNHGSCTKRCGRRYLCRNESNQGGRLQQDEGKHQRNSTRLSRPRQERRRSARSDSEFHRSSGAELRSRYFAGQTPSCMESEQDSTRRKRKPSAQLSQPIRRRPGSNRFDARPPLARIPESKTLRRIHRAGAPRE